MRPCVRSQRPQAMRQSALELQLERIVVGRCRIGYQHCAPKIWIRKRDVGRLYQPPSNRADVRGSYRLLVSQRLLHCNVPLKCIGKFEIGIEGKQRSRASTRGHYRGRRGCCRSQRIGTARNNLCSSKWISEMEDEISRFGCRKVIKQTESSTKYSLPILALRELVGHSNAGREIAVLCFIRRRAHRCQRQVRQVAEIEASYSVEARATDCRRHKVHVPAQSVGQGQARNDAPGILAISSKITKQERPVIA